MLTSRLSSGAASWRGPLVCAAGAAGLLCLTAILTFEVAGAGHLDAKAVSAFWVLQDPSTVNTMRAIANSANAVPFAIAIVVLAALALHTRQRRLLIPVAILLVGANLSTEALKGALPGHNPIFNGRVLQTVPSFPSGHATVAMSIALSLVLLTPCRGRTVIAWLAALYALAVGYAVLVLTSHFPSDVIAGYLMAAVWAALGLAAMRGLEHRKPAARRVPRVSSPTRLVPLLSVVAVPCGVGAVVAVATAAETSRVTLLLFGWLIAAVAVGVVASVALQPTVQLSDHLGGARARRPGRRPMLVAAPEPEVVSSMDEARSLRGS